MSTRFDAWVPGTRTDERALVFLKVPGADHPMEADAARELAEALTIAANYADAANARKAEGS